MIHDRHVVNADQIFRRVQSVGALLSLESSFTEQHLSLGSIYLSWCQLKFFEFFYVVVYTTLDQILVSTDEKWYLYVIIP